MKEVIIDVGLTGNCIAGHLAERGRKDMVLIEKKLYYPGIKDTVINMIGKGTMVP